MVGSHRAAGAAPNMTPGEYAKSPGQGSCGPLKYFGHPPTHVPMSPLTTVTRRAGKQGRSNVSAAAILPVPLRNQYWQRMRVGCDVQIGYMLVPQSARSEQRRVAREFRFHVPAGDIAPNFCLAVDSNSRKYQKQCPDPGGVVFHKVAVFRESRWRGVFR